LFQNPKLGKLLHPRPLAKYGNAHYNNPNVVGSLESHRKFLHPQHIVVNPFSAYPVA